VVVVVVVVVGVGVVDAVDCVCGHQGGAGAASHKIRNDPPDTSRLLLQFRRAGTELGSLLSFRREERAPYIDRLSIAGAEAGTGGVEVEARRGRSLDGVG